MHTCLKKDYTPILIFPIGAFILNLTSTYMVDSEHNTSPEILAAIMTAVEMLLSFLIEQIGRHCFSNSPLFKNNNQKIAMSQRRWWPAFKQAAHAATIPTTLTTLGLFIAAVVTERSFRNYLALLPNIAAAILSFGCFAAGRTLASGQERYSNGLCCRANKADSLLPKSSTPT